ncbi:Peroxisomal trans-2-enoyl-CoA reductase [Seminavis robusta]|uniref:Peroxisomal trans-2-enoyl-CoA reductase n=1 Tax=Seminavis robusta TaxID=568900 RepID=A0A9N8EXJ7_9STRA|nr:Peroxisomal trans-2-enoyl-CoA reductase [Seminavis robusta]|eukprot:Sro1999_g310160.1 Peroxisomal trans-2-enoyl-CoA reductase (282) ;mRNA; f:6907-7846
MWLLALVVTAALSLVSSIRTPPNVIVVGGSSGMGKAAALATIEHGGKCMLVSRSKDKLSTAKSYLLSQVPSAIIDTAVVDATNEEEVQEFAETLELGAWDGLVISAAGRAPHGPFTELPTSDARGMMESKFWTAYHCAKYISVKLNDGGCVVFVAGILNRRPGINCSPLAISNGALEGLTKSLALEFGPRLRCNCLSPGFCDTERFDHMTPDRKAKMIANTALSLPLQKIGEPRDMGGALYYLLTAQFCTGVILDVDGGHGIRQYASVAGDPMRAKEQTRQ